MVSRAEINDLLAKGKEVCDFNKYSNSINDSVGNKVKVQLHRDAYDQSFGFAVGTALNGSLVIGNRVRL